MPGADRGADPGGPRDTVPIGDDLLRFRDFRPGDEHQIIELFRAAFGSFYPAQKPVDEAGYIRWFAERHDSHRSRVMVGEIADRLVIVGAGLYRDIKVGDRVFYGNAGGVGGATHPAFQRLGISQARKRWSVATDDPPRTATVATRRWGAPAAGPALPFGGRMGVYLHVRRPWRAAQARNAGLAILSAVPAAGLALWSRLRPTIGGGGATDLTVRTLGEFDARFEPFLEEASAAWDVTPLRSAEFLNWRFCDPRAGEFVVRAAEEAGDLVGYSVLHAVGARGHVMDLLALPGRLDVVRTLVADAVRHLDEAGAAAIECWMLREHPYAQVLRQAGFVRLRGRSAEIDGELTWSGPGLGPHERDLLASPQTRTHLVRVDFDGI